MNATAVIPRARFSNTLILLSAVLIHFNPGAIRAANATIGRPVPIGKNLVAIQSHMA
jgi:hypothetical protein